VLRFRLPHTLIAMTGYPPLIELLWPQAAGVTKLRLTGWQALDHSAAQHRLRPLLHKRAAHHAPPALAAEWERAYHRAGMRALYQRAGLIRVTRALAAAGIETVALKGAAFVWQRGSDPALRPMRDLDLLVPEDRALEAHRLLRELGFEGESATRLTDDKHLPGLTGPNGVHVEVHTRLIDAFSPDGSRRDAAFRSAALARCERQGDLLVMVPGDTLLHVILHAVLDHQFNNGPLLLLDIAALARNGRIDWPRFWDLAAETGGTRACQLALRLGQDCLPGLAIDWRGNAPTDLTPAMLHDAAAMMLVDMDRRSELGVVGQMARLRMGERFARLGRQLGRSSARVDSGDAGSGRAALVRRYLGALLGRSGRSHIVRSLSVANWLRE
jgi:hypothetical protein